MLLTVRDSDLAFGRLADGLTRLIVVGVDWTLTPEQAAASLEALLAGHAWSGDLAFVAPGTPTNNTGTNRSGFSTAPSEQVAAWAPPVEGVDPDTAVDADAGRLASALGLGADALAVTPGAGGHHHRLAAALLDALWEATGGYFASDLADPHVTDAVAGHVRVHAAASLYASGPLPLIRVGPQPYGVLPVAPRRLAPHIGRGADLELHRVTGLLRSEWEQQIDRVPRLGRAGETLDVDDVMLDLLQRTPVPWHLRWREMVPPPQWSATDWLARLRTQQAPLVSDLLDRIGVPPNRPTRVQFLTASPDSYPLNVPLVRKGDAGTSYLAEIAALARAGDGGRRDLNLRQNSATLLEALLSFAATQELDRAASAELVDGMSGEAQAAAGFVRKGVRTPDLVRVEEPDPTRLPLQFATARALAAATAPGTNVPVHDRVAQRLREAPLTEHIGSTTSPVNGLARFLAALDSLAGADPDELEWAFRGVLDLFSTRLDAWITSLATARLTEHRAAKPTGVHLGCYGWVEDLQPDRGPAAESLGFIAAPSLDHAVAAAVLRSGRQAHIGRERLRPRPPLGPGARGAHRARGRRRRPAARRAARLPHRAPAARRPPRRPDRAAADRGAPAGPHRRPRRADGVGGGTGRGRRPPAARHPAHPGLVAARRRASPHRRPADRRSRRSSARSPASPTRWPTCSSPRRSTRPRRGTSTGPVPPPAPSTARNDRSSPTWCARPGTERSSPTG